MPRQSTIRLNRRVIDSLTVETGDAVTWDREVTGFGMRVYASGRNIYVVQTRGPLHLGSRRCLSRSSHARLTRSCGATGRGPHRHRSRLTHPLVNPSNTRAAALPPPLPNSSRTVRMLQPRVNRPSLSSECAASDKEEAEWTA